MLCELAPKMQFDELECKGIIRDQTPSIRLTKQYTQTCDLADANSMRAVHDSPGACLEVAKAQQASAPRAEQQLSGPGSRTTHSEALAGIRQCL